MFSVITQEKTPIRDNCGGSVYRRFYLCDEAEDVEQLPVSDAPGTVAYVIDSGMTCVLDHRRAWHPCPEGGIPWRT